MSTRVKMLEEAARLTAGDRDATYGDPTTQHRCMGQLMEVFDRFDVNKDSPAHRAAMFLILNKVSRIACGKLKDDNYIDGAAYFAIAGEARDEERTRERVEPILPSVALPKVRRRVSARKTKQRKAKR